MKIKTIVVKYLTICDNENITTPSEILYHPVYDKQINKMFSFYLRGDEMTPISTSTFWDNGNVATPSEIIYFMINKLTTLFSFYTFVEKK